MGVAIPVRRGDYERYTKMCTSIGISVRDAIPMLLDAYDALKATNTCSKCNKFFPTMDQAEKHEPTCQGVITR